MVSNPRDQPVIKPVGSLALIEGSGPAKSPQLSVKLGSAR
jgi:hypothetical protein